MRFAVVGWAERSEPTILQHEHQSSDGGHGAKRRLCPPYGTALAGKREADSWMAGCGGDLLDPLQRNTLTLLDGKRVIGRLQNDSRAQIAGSNKYVTANFVGLRVTSDPVTEPTEARWFVFGDFRIPF
jgi:hypothetical protein